MKCWLLPKKQKQAARRAEAAIRAAEIAFAFASRGRADWSNAAFDDLMSARKLDGLAQHHDAITGAASLAQQ